MRFPDDPTLRQLRALRADRDAIDAYLKEHSVTIYQLFLLCSSTDDAARTAQQFSSPAGFPGLTFDGQALPIKGSTTIEGAVVRVDMDVLHADDVARVTNLYGGQTGRHPVIMQTVPAYDPAAPPAVPDVDAAVAKCAARVLEPPPAKGVAEAKVAAAGAKAGE